MLGPLSLHGFETRNQSAVAKRKTQYHALSSVVYRHLGPVFNLFSLIQSGAALVCCEAISSPSMGQPMPATLECAL